jgi:predicted metal-dependent hydrolase
MFRLNHSETFYIGKNRIPVLIKKGIKIKRISITVKTDGSVILSCPRIVRDSYLVNLLESKVQWIEKKVSLFKSRHPVLSIKHSRKEYQEHSKEALILVKERLQYFNQYYDLQYKNISIKNQRTRWGSCSSKKNLSFNYKIIFLPKEYQDYLIVHELCHLKEMNHSKGFWDLVGERIGNYKILSKKLRVGDF